MELELVISNDPRTMPGVRAFTHETLRQLGMPPGEAEQLEGLIIGAVQNAVEHAYPDGEEGSIRLSLREKNGKLESLVRDYGIPQDVASMERQLHEPGAAISRFSGSSDAHAADELHWIAYGPEGKAFQILKWLHVTPIQERGDAGTMEPFQADVPLAPEQKYEIGKMHPDEAVQVSQLMYRTYGNTYFNADVYYPERLAAQHANGSVISLVARAQDGSVVGHYALERNEDGPVAETGQAVVDPAHRGRGLMGRMKQAALQESQQLQLVGWYADAVCVHTLTQTSNADHGGVPTCAELGISPKTEKFKGFGAVQPQRVTCLLFFHWLTERNARTIYIPEKHRGIVAEIYENLQCPVQWATGEAPSGHGDLVVKIESGAGKASIRANVLGADTVHAVRHAKRELVERSHAEVVFVELPLDDPGTPHVIEELERDGFGFAGVAPHFSSRGDLIRLVYLVEPLAREPIKALDGFASRLVDYALAEQESLNDAM